MRQDPADILEALEKGELEELLGIKRKNSSLPELVSGSPRKVEDTEINSA